mgnify:FL=1
MTVIGITGPTGAGKTTVLKEIEALGGAVIDCDAIDGALAAQLLNGARLDPEGFAAICHRLAGDGAEELMDWLM